MKTFKQVIIERFNILVESKLNTKEDIKQAVALWKNLPQAKKASEAKKIIKASKDLGYPLKQQEILSYGGDTREYLKTKKDKSVDTRNAFAFKVGDIVYSEWGFGQTNIDFYQIQEIKGKRILLAKIKSKIVSQDYLAGSKNLIPDVNNFMQNVKPFWSLVTVKEFLGRPSYRFSGFEKYENVSKYSGGNKYSSYTA
jgi:hypothetical protein